MRTMRGGWAFVGRPVRVRLALALPAVLATSVLTTVLMLRMQPIEAYLLSHVVKLSGYLMPLLNFLPVLLVSLLLLFASGGIALPCLGASGVFLLMALVNRVKLLLRGDPLLHWDFSLAGEVAGIAQGYGRGLLAAFFAALALYIGVTVLLGRKIRLRPMPCWARVTGAAACALVIAALNATVYSSAALYESLPVWGSFYNLADVHNSRGNLYCFLYNLNAHRVKTPQGYDERAVRDAINVLGPAGTAVETTARPHIVMIMGESLSALSDSGVLDFTGFRDPLETFKALGGSFVSGSLVVPSRGGGTADTEFDVLTGRASRYLRTAPYAYRMLTGPTEALPSMLGRIGYTSLALHPGYSWFYNRQNVYRYLGFDTARFEDAFPREAYLDTYIGEAATYDMLLSMLEAHMAEPDAAPLFAFCLTIQNHAAYYNRYLPEGTVNFSSSVSMSVEETNILSNYFQGVIDADVQLERLAGYLESLDEPAVLVCFGDHLPSLDMALYEKLIPGADATEETFTSATRLYTVPFLIWLNTAAAENTDIAGRAAAAAMPENRIISSNYLGGYLLELLGYEDLSPFFSYGNDLRAVFPVLLDARQFRPDETPGEPSGTEEAMLRLYRDWGYFLTE